MEAFLEREEATTTSQLVGILPGSPPQISLVDYGSGRNGVKRHFTQQVPVPDENLFAKLQREVKIGDHIRATVVNEYRETGSVIFLAGFQNASDPALSSGVQNSNGSHAQNSRTETTATAERKTKVKQLR